jgi:hypothetical protein
MLFRQCRHHLRVGSAIFALSILCLLLALTFATAQSERTPLSNKDVVSMIKAKLGDETILNAIEAQPSRFDISASGLLTLKKEGASPKIIDAVVSATTINTRTAASGTAGNSRSSGAIEQSPAELAAEQAADPRLKAVSADDRKFILDEAASAIGYCKTNDMLMNLYSCSCFSGKVLNERIKTNGQTIVERTRKRIPFVNLIASLDISECVVPAKITKYGTNRAYETLKMDPNYSTTQLDQISQCVGADLTERFQAQPISNIRVIDGMFSSALIPCRERIMNGQSAISRGTLRNAPSTATRAPQAEAGAAPQTSATQSNRAPQRTSIFDRFKQAQDRANAAIQRTVGASAPPPNQSAQSTGRSMSAANQQINANNALFHAIITNNPVACSDAIKQGAQVNSLYNQDTMLNEAAMAGGLDVTRCLVEHGADVNAVGRLFGQNMSPVWVAATKRHFDTLTYLIEKGANVNVLQGNQSLLMFMVADGDLDSVKLLVEHGADINYTRQGNHGPQTALTVAKAMRHADEIEYLEAHGAH